MYCIKNLPLKPFLSRFLHIDFCSLLNLLLFEPFLLRRRNAVIKMGCCKMNGKVEGWLMRFFTK